MDWISWYLVLRYYQCHHRCYLSVASWCSEYKPESIHVWCSSTTYKQLFINHWYWQYFHQISYPLYYNQLINYLSIIRSHLFDDLQSIISKIIINLFLKTISKCLIGSVDLLELLLLLILILDFIRMVLQCQPMVCFFDLHFGCRWVDLQYIVKVVVLDRLY